MKLLEARDYVREYDDLEETIEEAKTGIKKLNTDLSHDKKARDGHKKGSGQYQYQNAQVILIRQQIKYWKQYIDDTKERMSELIDKFEQ